MRPDFVVNVTHEGKPLPGVGVWILSVSNQKEKKLTSIVTSTDGTVNIAGLSPGEYSLTAELFGIEAGSECFHVDFHTTSKAKKTVRYEWGELAPATRQIAGTVVDSPEVHPLLKNSLPRVDVPIREARLKLHVPFTGAVYETVSDSAGNFSFGEIPNGTYVLQLDGGPAGRGPDYETTYLLIRLSDTAEQPSLSLERSRGFPGSCRDTSLEVQDTAKRETAIPSNAFKG